MMILNSLAVGLTGHEKMLALWFIGICVGAGLIFILSAMYSEHKLAMKKLDCDTDRAVRDGFDAGYKTAKSEDVESSTQT
jgi:hypothetical protein